MPGLSAKVGIYDSVISTRVLHRPPPGRRHPPQPLHSAQDTLGDRLAAVAELPPDDLASLLNIIDGLVAKNRLKTLASGMS
jgi:hypothetical protein